MLRGHFLTRFVIYISKEYLPCRENLPCIAWLDKFDGQHIHTQAQKLDVQSILEDLC